MDDLPDVQAVGTWVVPELERLREWQRKYLQQEELAKRALWAIVKHRHRFNNKCFAEVSLPEIATEMNIIYQEMHGELIKDPDQFKKRVTDKLESYSPGPYHQSS